MALFPIFDGRLYGYADATGTVVIPPRFTSLPIGGTGCFSDGRALAFEKKKAGFIDEAGAWVVEPRWDGARPLSEGRAAVAVKKKGVLRWGLVDREGAPAGGGGWYKVGAFAGGRAFVEREPGTGLELVDSAGARVGDAVFAGSKNERDITMRARPFSEGLAGAADVKTGLWGFVDPAGAWVLPPRWKALAPFSCGLACVQDADNIVSFVDREGREALRWALPYLALASFSEGLVRSPDPIDSLAKAYLGLDGAVVIPARREHAGGFAYGRALYTLPSGYSGFIDRTGTVVIPPTYVYAEGFVDGLARVVPDPKKPGRFGYVNVAGDLAIAP
ncbi:MAG: WG repeat-containing protein [Pseudomonadota bacterium]|nr:WG repeat-containing protein [Pseudomonadota bacterium]